MEVVQARLDIEVFVNCPHCDFLIDLMNEDDTDGVAENDDGIVIRQACPDGLWTEAHKSFSVVDVTCSKCKGAFNVSGLDW